MPVLALPGRWATTVISRVSQRHVLCIEENEAGPDCSVGLELWGILKCMISNDRELEVKLQALGRGTL